MTGHTPELRLRPTPFVSVVVPVYNEERHIRTCLASILGQDYPQDRYEVIVADGGSTDRTRDIVQEIASSHPNVRLIDNPGRTQAAGLNRAILASSGDFVARQDGHAEWTPHHLSRSIELLLQSGADNVGGQQKAIGTTTTGRAVACAMSSPFGVGGARFRYSQQLEEVTTVFLGTFRRTVFTGAGMFNEAYPPHEDYELNHRIRACGGRILYSPDIPVRYHVRESLRELARQYFLYGRAKVRVAWASPGVMRPYHLAAPCLVAAVAGTPVFLVTRSGRRLGICAAAAYAAACVAAGARCTVREPAAVRLRAPFVFPVLHMSWGAGFWIGVFEHRSGPRR
jgi:glycosyltransferase involved in cell wall biosynthesis